MQPNHDWDDEAEMNEWLKANIPSGFEVVRTWRVEKIRCIIKVNDKKKEEKKR